MLLDVTSDGASQQTRTYVNMEVSAEGGPKPEYKPEPDAKVLFKVGVSADRKLHQTRFTCMVIGF